MTAASPRSKLPLRRFTYLHLLNHSQICRENHTAAGTPTNTTRTLINVIFLDSRTTVSTGLPDIREAMLLSIDLTPGPQYSDVNNARIENSRMEDFSRS